mgnify:FL=1
MYGVALEGGGARGAYHIGALKALMENGYEISGIVGTSIGAFNAAVVAQGDFDKLYKFWTSSTSADLLDVNIQDVVKIVNKKIDFDLVKNITDFVKVVASNKGMDTAKYKQTLDKLIDEKKLRKSKKDYGLVTVSWTDKKPLELYKEDIPEGMISSYVLASSYLPVFKSEKIGDKVFIDGGFYNNCPVDMLVKKGYKNIIEIRTKAVGIYKKIKVPKDVNVITIVPKDDLGSVLFADKDLANKNVQMGYYDALKVINKLKGNNYYIKDIKPGVFFESLLKLSDKQILDIAEGCIKVNKEKEARKVLFENILPDISRKLKLSKALSYNDLLIEIAEYLVASEELVEKYEVHELKDIILEIKKNSSRMLRKERMSLVRNTAKEMAIKLIKEIDIENM